MIKSESEPQIILTKSAVCLDILLYREIFPGIKVF